MNDDELDEVMAEFVIESRENLDQLDHDLLDLEHNHDDEVVARIFRTIHTIKGNSGFLGLGALEALTHVGESLLAKVRDHSLPVTADITSGLLALVDAVREILDAVAAAGTEGELAYPHLIERLTTLASPPVDEPVHATGMLGSQLLRDGKITEEQLAEALRMQDEGDPRRLGEILVELQAISPAEARDALRTQIEEHPNAGETIRVDVRLLDDLMNLVGELVLARNQIVQLTHTGADPALGATAQRLNSITSELQAGVMKTRLQPLDNVWSRFPRIVRDLTTNCAKQARLEMEGRHTELDKTLLEAIKDPLTHLIRNAVDHGLEHPDERIACGKPAEGVIRLRAYHDGGQVVVEISDDGAGIDAAKVRAKAVERGLMSVADAEARTDREMLNVIFQAGFTTAETVSNISGRGVGMDVVRANIEGIGGSVEVSTVVGRGTTFRVRIPLTLAIVPALIVAVGAERFAIPQVCLLELVRLEPSRDSEGRGVLGGVEWIQGAPVHRLRGHLLPLVFLRDLFADPAAARPIGSGSGEEPAYIAVVHADEHQFGLVVDSISDTAEIVVKPLGRVLGDVIAFSGATIMGDGHVALILDVMGIARLVGITSGERRWSLDAAPEPTEVTETRVGTSRQLLVCRIGKRRLALPLELVARLEELAPGDVELTGRRSAVQYKGAIMELVDLGRELQIQSERAEQQPLPVVVVRNGEMPVGLIVDEIFDIVDEEVELEDHSAGFGIMATALVGGSITDIVDVRQILRATAPGPLAVAPEAAA